MRTRIKFCGLVSAADVTTAVALGVDAIGLVFYPRSTRFLTRADALALRRYIPSYVRCVGLFVNESTEQVRELRDALGLDVIQFHGDESREQCESAAGNTPYWRAVRMRSRSDLLESKAQYVTAEALLLDTFSAGYGGSGQSFDWSWISPSTDAPYVLSGGLTLATVAQAIQQTAPLYVDVSSGIQTEDPRRKDPLKMTEFVRRVLEQDALIARSNTRYT
jgi:phosphoribosylanthranilate isomerase